MADVKEVEIFIAMDSDGDWETGSDQETAVSNYNDSIGGCGPLRVVKLTAKMRPPVITETEVTVPDEAGQEVGAAA
jgi:hypothetical protein